VCCVCEFTIPSKFVFFALQRAVDNAEAVKDIEKRVHSLSDLLASPVSKDDHAEKARRTELHRFALVVQTRTSLLTPSQKTRECSRET
jgi:hypothetical protein